MESPDFESLDERTLASARSKSDQMMEAVTVTFVDDEFLALIVMGLRPGVCEPEQQADEIWRPPLIESIWHGPTHSIAGTGN